MTMLDKLLCEIVFANLVFINQILYLDELELSFTRVIYMAINICHTYIAPTFHLYMRMVNSYQYLCILALLSISF